MPNHTPTTTAVFHVDLWSFLDAVVAAQGATGCPAEGSGLVRALVDAPVASARHLKVIR